MRVLLISANTERMNMRTLPLGLSCVAEATERAGHEVAMLDLMAQQDFREAVGKAIGDVAPEVIGISVRNIDDQNRASPSFLLARAREVVEACRAACQACLVVGGAGYSIFPESALLYLGADLGIWGEGEEAFPELLGRLERGSDLAGMAGLVLPGKGLPGERRFASDLEVFALPALHWFSAGDPKDGELWIPIQSRRGCALDCSYCSTARIEGRLSRQRSASSAVEFLERCARAGCERFFFVDNNFNLPLSYAHELCRLILARGLKVSWRCIFNPLQGDPGLIEEMAQAGCGEVSLGFESGCARMLGQLNKRFSLQQVRESAEALARCGIRRNGFLLLGGPGETRESVEESLAFADSLSLEMVRVTSGIRIYPQTRLAATALAEGVIGPGDDLLQPRFYLAPGLEPWLKETLGRWKGFKPRWVF